MGVLLKITWQRNVGHSDLRGFGLVILKVLGPRVKWCVPDPLLIFHSLHTSNPNTALVIVMGWFDNAGLFCGEENLIVALRKENETPFCTLSGNHHNHCMRFVHRKFESHYFPPSLMSLYFICSWGGGGGGSRAFWGRSFSPCSPSRGIAMIYHTHALQDASPSS